MPIDDAYDFATTDQIKRRRHYGYAMILIIFFIGIFLLMLDSPVQAYNNGTGVLTYYTETPRGDPLSLYVHRGDTIYMDRNYDLTGVMDYNYTFAYWKNYANADNDCNPDITINVNYVDTGGKVKPSNVPINRAYGWVPGDWWVWDGCKEHRSLTKDAYGNLQVSITYGQDPQDNRFAFHLVDLPGVTRGPAPDPCWDTHSCGTTTISTFGTPVPVATETPFAAEPVKNEGIPIWMYLIGAVIVVIGFWIAW